MDYVQHVQHTKGAYRGQRVTLLHGPDHRWSECVLVESTKVMNWVKGNRFPMFAGALVATASLYGEYPTDVSRNRYFEWLKQEEHDPVKQNNVKRSFSKDGWFNKVFKYKSALTWLSTTMTKGWVSPSRRRGAKAVKRKATIQGARRMRQLQDDALRVTYPWRMALFGNYVGMQRWKKLMRLAATSGFYGVRIATDVSKAEGKKLEQRNAQPRFFGDNLLRFRVFLDFRDFPNFHVCVVSV